jgi:pyrroline-5-carboxylate reductase
MKVHIIGGGNLGVSIALGIVKFSKNNQVTVTRRNTASIQYLAEYGITVSSDNKHNIQEADVVILTIKPYQVDTVFAEILPVIKNKTIASAVSGLSLDMLQTKTNNEYPVVRIMPNIAAQFGESATCISFPEKHREKALPIVDLFQDLGTAPVIDEKLMDAATVLAYALRYIRASMQAGIEIGFDSNTALAIAAQTVKGAAKMLLEEKVHPEQLIDRVTTPQGCTIVGLNEMEHNGFSSSLIKGIKTSLKQIKG